MFYSSIHRNLKCLLEGIVQSVSGRVNDNNNGNARVLGEKEVNKEEPRELYHKPEEQAEYQSARRDKMGCEAQSNPIGSQRLGSTL